MRYIFLWFNKLVTFVFPEHIASFLLSTDTHRVRATVEMTGLTGNGFSPQ